EITPPSPRSLIGASSRNRHVLLDKALARLHIRVQQDRARRGGDAASLLARDRYRRAHWHRLRQPQISSAGAAAEKPGGLDAPPGDHPRLVGLAGAGRLEDVDREDGLTCRRDADSGARALGT